MELGNDMIFFTGDRLMVGDVFKQISDYIYNND